MKRQGFNPAFFICLHRKVNLERKLVSVRTINKLIPIENATNIELAQIDGWQCVVKKGDFSEQDPCVFFEIDSFLPIRPEFEFLRKSGYKKTSHLGEGFRLKTIKLRGQLSQGLAIPLHSVLSIQQCEEHGLKPGVDLTELIGVKKYEPPIPAQLAGKVKGNFPPFLQKTDSERAQNVIKDISKFYYHSYFEVTVKLDGSSMTVYNNGDDSGVCSRNLNLLEDDKNSFWKVARNRKLIDLVKQYKEKYNINIALQGELIGPGVQKNREGLKELDFYLFNIYNVDEKRYLGPNARSDMMEQFKEMGYEVNHVPILGKFILQHLAPDHDNVIGSLLTFASGKSINSDNPREGLVFKHYGSDFNFKIINNDYLLQFGD